MVELPDILKDMIEKSTILEDQKEPITVLCALSYNLGLSDGGVQALKEVVGIIND